ncbi:hypothetical protein, partial [Bacillus toyonensis]|uniref:hypothetical protein n=1 Tax=Bacillus toyonensis TaxID=155322 RepID=UPI0036F265B7
IFHLVVEIKKTYKHLTFLYSKLNSDIILPQEISPQNIMNSKKKRTHWRSGSFRSDDVFSASQSEKIQKYNTLSVREFQY